MRQNGPGDGKRRRRGPGEKLVNRSSWPGLCTISMAKLKSKLLSTYLPIRQRIGCPIIQGLNGSWKSWKVLEFHFGIFQDWKVLENDYKSWKVREICKLCFNHVIFTISIACGTACKAYSKNKVIVDIATG